MKLKHIYRICEHLDNMIAILGLNIPYDNLNESQTEMKVDILKCKQELEKEISRKIKWNGYQKERRNK